uniref:Uncharacterized protein n=1 Tax=Arundo donax TaxID=35708 RepID=A0A0A8ZNG2_ARUDO
MSIIIATRQYKDGSAPALNKAIKVIRLTTPRLMMSQACSNL